MKQDWDPTIALRYLPIVNIINTQFTPSDSVLEVGSGPLGICPYLHPPRKITGLDVDFGFQVHPLLKPIKYTGTKLPFKDKTFDLIISVDTLEHIPIDDRKKAITEMVRVARKGIIIAIPTGKAAHLADKFLNWYYQKTHHEKSQFLKEHLTYPLPETRLVNKWLEEEIARNIIPAKIKIFNNTFILVWLSLLALGFSQNKYLCRLFKYSLFILPLLNLFHFPPAYRKIIYLRMS